MQTDVTPASRFQSCSVHLMFHTWHCPVVSACTLNSSSVTSPHDSGGSKPLKLCDCDVYARDICSGAGQQNEDGGINS